MEDRSNFSLKIHKGWDLGVSLSHIEYEYIYAIWEIINIQVSASQMVEEVKEKIEMLFL